MMKYVQTDLEPELISVFSVISFSESLRVLFTEQVTQILNPD